MLKASFAREVMVADDEEIEDNFETEGSFGRWLQSELSGKNITIQDLANKTGLSYEGIRLIVKGEVKSPQQATIKRISQALQSQIPSDVEQDITAQASVSGYTWTDFSPYDLQTIP